MAIGRPGIIGDVSGRIGGTEVALTKGRLVLKQAKVVRSRVSDRTRAAQANQAAALKYWEAMTDAQRSTWEVTARQKPYTDRFGQKTYKNGRELFLEMPHDWRFGIGPWWYDYPPQLVYTYVTEPSITTLTTTTVALDLMVVGAPTRWVASMWIARFTKSYKRQHRGWFKGGLCEFNMTTQPPIFTSSMAALGVKFVSGEQVAMRVQFSQERFWPQWWDFGVVTIP